MTHAVQQGTKNEREKKEMYKEKLRACPGFPMGGEEQVGRYSFHGCIRLCARQLACS